MTMRPDRATHVVVMAKPVMPGRVKTRLIPDLGPQRSAAVHAAMLQCVLRRAVKHLDKPNHRGGFFLAVDHTALPGPDTPLFPGLDISPSWRLIDQGRGDLGQRLAHVWQAIGDGAIFLGIDSPDAPAESLAHIVPALAHADIAVGPVHDGGYWTIAGRQFDRRILERIDWGTPSVYHQTLDAARRSGLRVAELERWYDVDTLDDLLALMVRIDQTRDPALMQLRATLDRLHLGAL